MNNLKKDLLHLLKNQKGMALMFVMSIIGIFSLLMYAFKFDVKLGLIKSQNSRHKYQARLNAESGLHLALIRLEIYAHLLNYLNENPQASKVIETSMINQVWSLPLKLPIEATALTSTLDKNAIEKFQENFLMEGEVLISTSSYGNKINLNLMRESQFTAFLRDFEKRTSTSTSTTTTLAISPENADESNPAKQLQVRFKELLEQSILSKISNDEFFSNKYSGISVDELIGAIRYYTSDKDQDIGPLTNQMAAEFQKINLTPKHAPMTSITELNLLPFWDDELIALIENEVTVHGNMVIDINKITANILKLLIPQISDENIKMFFEYKNDPNLDSEFETIDDLGSYFINEQRIIAEEDFKDRATILEKAGISFGAKPELFEISIEGKYNNSTYTLNAIVEIARVQKEDSKTPAIPGAPSTTTTTTTLANQSGKSQKKKFEYSKPRVLEIFVN